MVSVLQTVVKLVQWCQVIEDPQGASLRGDHEVILLHIQVGDGYLWQVLLQALPDVAIVKRDE